MTAVQLWLVGEDALCGALGEALLVQSGIPIDIVQRQIAGGASPLKAKIPILNNVASKVMPVLMIADADQAGCVVTQRNDWWPAHASANLALRLAVKEAEAWVLADYLGFAEFAKISPGKLPPAPEMIEDPKRALLNLIKDCKRRELRDEMLPGKHSSSPVGLGYNQHLTQFVRDHWQASRAAQRSPSLARSITRIAALLARQEASG